MQNHPQKIDLKSNIQIMLTKEVDPFLILEETKTQKFIQFYNEKNMILIDLPKIALTENEIDKAKIFFGKYNIKLTEKESTEVETMEQVKLETWSHLYPPEKTEIVANIALGAMYEVYGFSKSNSFIFIKGWE